MVLYSAACEECSFVFESACDATTHHVAEQHEQSHPAHWFSYGSYDERNSPFTNQQQEA